MARWQEVLGAKRFFIAVAVVNQLGNWLTFVAVIIFAQTTYGSTASVSVLLAQSLPALLAARALSDRVRPSAVGRVWVLLQMALAVLSIAAAFVVQSLTAVLVYVAVSMLARAVAAPLLLTLVSDSTSGDDRQATLTGVGAAGSIALTIAPAGGGALLPLLGMSLLLWITAATYLLSAVMMVLGRRLVTLAPDTLEQPVRPLRLSLPSPAALLRAPGTTTGILRVPATACWTVMITIGAILNAVETPYSFDILGLTEAEFGVALTCYGAGGLIVLVLSAVSSRRVGGVVTGALLHGIGLGCWLIGFLPLVLVGFVLAGFGGAQLAGAIRTDLADWADRAAVDVKDVWGWTNQIVLLLNLVVYGVAAALFALAVDPRWPAVVMLMLFVPLLVWGRRSAADR